MNQKSKQSILDNVSKMLDASDVIVRVQTELSPATKAHPADSNSFVVGNRKTIIIVATLCMLLAARVNAQQTTGEKVADWTSTGLVGVNIAADAVYSVKHHCLKNYVLKNVLSVASAEGLKLVIHEERPDHSDMKSFPSEHSWLAAANAGWSYKIGWTIAFGAGTGRVLADKHHPWDVAVGLLAGAGADLLFPCQVN